MLNDENSLADDNARAYEAIARRIDPHKKNRFLTYVLRCSANCLAGHCSTDRMRFTRSEIRERCNYINDAIAKLADGNPDENLDNKTKIELRRLHEERKLMEQTLIEFTTQDGRLKRGRGRSTLYSRVEAKTFCAAIVSFLYFHCNGVWPGARSLRAVFAAGELWRLATGANEISSPNSPETWRRYFELARSPELQDELALKLTFLKRDLEYWLTTGVVSGSLTEKIVA